MTEFPILTDSRCRLLTACGRLLTKDAEIIRNLGEFRERKISVIGEDSTKQYIVIWGGGKTGDTHLHIDIVSMNYLQKPLEITSTLAEMDGILSRFTGQSIDVHTLGRFTVPINQLPEQGLIRGTLLEMTSADMGIKQSGGTFTVSRGPVERVEWTLSKNVPNAVDVELEVEKTVPFDSSYLPNLLNFVTTAFNALIIGKPLNDNI